VTPDTNPTKGNQLNSERRRAFSASSQRNSASRRATRLADEVDRLRAQVEALTEALADIVNASRDEGLAAMCNWMRGRAAVALRGRK
jgi:hypothetical protein